MGSPSPAAVSRGNNLRDESNMNTRRTRNQDGSKDLQQGSTGNNTKRTSVLRKKDGEHIKQNGRISVPFPHGADSEGGVSQESYRIEALKV